MERKFIWTVNPCYLALIPWNSVNLPRRLVITKAIGFHSYSYLGSGRFALEQFTPSCDLRIARIPDFIPSADRFFPRDIVNPCAWQRCLPGKVANYGEGLSMLLREIHAAQQILKCGSEMTDGQQYPLPTVHAGSGLLEHRSLVIGPWCLSISLDPSPEWASRIKGAQAWKGLPKVTLMVSMQARRLVQTASANSWEILSMPHSQA